MAQPDVPFEAAVAALLNLPRFRPFTKIFAEQRIITVRAAKELTDSDLSQLGMNLMGDRKEFLALAREIVRDGGKTTLVPDARAPPALALPDTKRIRSRGELEEGHSEDDESESSSSRPPSHRSPALPLTREGQLPCFVDPCCPQAASSTLFKEGDVAYGTVLNLCNIGQNNNKFHIIQLLCSRPGQTWYTWHRWGRVGEVGQSKLETFTSVNAARVNFMKKFREKTGNEWGALPFVPHKGKFVSLGISDLTSTQDEPLGKLPLTAAHQVLSSIHTEVSTSGSTGRQDSLVELSSQFYTFIPHIFGMAVPPCINTAEKVQAKLQLLQRLVGQAK